MQSSNRQFFSRNGGRYCPVVVVAENITEGGVVSRVLAFQSLVRGGHKDF